MVKCLINHRKFKIGAIKFLVFKIQLLQKKANFAFHKIRN